MAGLPWTKFQDFYLRLGFLKVLAGVLSPERRSAANEALYRRLRAPLFASAREYSHLAEATKSLLASHGGDAGAAERGPGQAKKAYEPSVAEALLVAGECPSLLFAITEPTVYKILDWGHDVGLVGR